MKKMLLILALSVFGFANAQKGTILVGGNISYNSNKIEREDAPAKTDAFAFSPKVGYQFHDNWTAGVEFALGSSKSTLGEGEGKSKDYKIGGFVRYTYPLSETFSVFADLGVGYQNQKFKSYESGSLTSTNEGKGIYTGITPALFINMKKGFGLNFSIGGLGYETLNYDISGGDVDSSQFYFNFGKTVNIGISKNF
ncbi:outer membrane beta-barrel protein [Flavobacterium ginsenosidimutans]|uniref:Outer membrane beta-barrel protein n=1 Tax=Flavobacterium ginsenosidimutans TaxID=687844 RepID=A0ABZ2QIM6_9FLAO|nr:outer membrane beta-barrel protein [Flavobacterium ginsenosidimutans]KAF2329621.1 porin family protein [Flavobacterium ginsenosidimutans]